MASERTSIWNLTDVKPRPRALNLFKQKVLPGGRLVIPMSRLATPSERRRLVRMQGNRDIFVGPEPPAWYRKLKEGQRVNLRKRQSQVVPPRRVNAAPPPEAKKPEPKPEPLFDVEMVMKRVKRLSKPDLLKFTTFVRPQMLIADSMTMKEVYKAMEDAFADGAKLVPLKDALIALGLVDEE